MKTLLALFQLVLIAIAAIWYVRLAVGPGAVRATGAVWRDWRKTFRLAVGIWLAIFVFDVIQTGGDAEMTRSLGEDYTGLIHGIEGSFVAGLQSFLGFRPFTDLLSLAYLILFPGMLFGLAFAYDRLGDDASLKRTAYVYSLNYLLCLPFYIFMPVREPWHEGASGVLPLMDKVHPWLIDIVRPMSGLDNCFPSYHVSLTVSLMLIAWETGPRAFSRGVHWSGGLIILSTVVLGFHWVTDLLAGVVAGVFIHVVAKRMALSPVAVPVTTRS